MVQWLFPLIVLGFALAGQADDGSPYPVEAEREKALAQLDFIENQQIEISPDGLAQRPRKERLFLDYYLGEVVPIKLEVRRDTALAAVLTTMIDRALYGDEEEKRRWMERKRQLLNGVSATMASDGWRDKIRTLAGLSHGLEGELPSWAERALRDGIIAPEELPLVQRNDELDIKIVEVGNGSSVTGNDLSEHAKEKAIIERRFRAGEIALEEAQRRIDALWPKSLHAKGYDVWRRGRDLIDEKAVVLTRRARMRGFSNWADYTFSLRNHTHRQGLRSADDHIRFFTEALEETRESAGELHRTFLQRAGLGEEAIVSEEAMPLLYPEANILLREYFPAEAVDGMWKETMRESGFGDFGFGQITFDSFPREKKQTHAYMSSSLSNIPKTIRIRPGELALDVPPLSPDFYHPGLISVVQSVKDSGVFPYEIVFHEGGHALDYAHRENTVILGEDTIFHNEAYAYSETASMTMQRFFDDEDFLLAKGVTREGATLDRARVQRFLQARNLLNRLTMRELSLRSLFDVLIWSEAYEEGGPRFSDRALDIYRKLYDKYFFGRSSLPEGVARGHRFFATMHFYSGLILYHGYVYADIAAQMEADYLWNELAKTTGRRTFLRQQTLAPLLIDGQYRRGFARPFPSTTEQMTGQKFHPQRFIDDFRRPVDDFIASSRNRGCRGTTSPLIK